MSFSATKRHQARIGSHLKGEENIYSLNKHALGPGELAESEWLKAGLSGPDMTKIRQYRLKRVREKLVEHDYAGILLYDPCLLYTSPSPRDATLSRMPSSA